MEIQNSGQNLRLGELLGESREYEGWLYLSVLKNQDFSKRTVLMTCIGAGSVLTASSGSSKTFPAVSVRA
jgi:hypothetical protein